MRQSPQIAKRNNICWWEKDEETQTLNFFPGSNMLVRWVTSRLTLPLEPPPKKKKIGARKLSSPYIFVTGVQLNVFTLSRLIQFSKNPSCLLPSAWCRWEGYPLPLALHIRTRSLDLQFSLDILITTSALARLFRDCLLYLFIYLSIQFQFSMIRSITLHTFLMTI